jgi:15-cis-phytoene synthase
MVDPADPVASLAAIDRDAYVATLMAPAGVRADLAALHAFAAEIQAIPLRIREPMAGMVRLQWWRDALTAGGPTGNPVADAVIALVAGGRLPLQPLLDLLEARSFDLYDDPMPGRTQLEGYLGETRSVLIQLACLILAPSRADTVADAAGHAGCAVGLVDILNGLADGRTRNLVPLDILGAAAVDAEEFRSGGAHARLAVVAEAMVALAHDHLGRVGAVASDFRPAFAKASLARPMLAAIRRRAAAIHREPVQLSPFRRQWTMMKFGLTGRP